MKCIYHNDLDGRCAAAIVKKWHEKFETSEVEFFEMDYKSVFPLSRIRRDETVTIVDFSLKPQVMNSLLKITPNVVWLDHHKTAKEMEQHYDKYVAGIRDYEEPGRSGAELAWDWFFMHQEAPLAVRITGSYDTWRHNVDDDFAFNEGTKMSGYEDPGNEAWAELLEFDYAVEEVVRMGYIAIDYRDNYCRSLRKIYGFETAFCGFNCYALNVYRLGSQAFGDLINQYEICIAYIHDGVKFTVSLYTERDNIDVSIIAKKYDGGGHTQAAGFVCDKLPFGKVVMPGDDTQTRQ